MELRLERPKTAGLWKDQHCSHWLKRHQAPHSAAGRGLRWCQRRREQLSLSNNVSALQGMTEDCPRRPFRIEVLCGQRRSGFQQVQMTGWSKIPPTNDANNEGFLGGVQFLVEYALDGVHYLANDVGPAHWTRLYFSIFLAESCGRPLGDCLSL